MTYFLTHLMTYFQGVGGTGDVGELCVPLVCDGEPVAQCAHHRHPLHSRVSGKTITIHNTQQTKMQMCIHVSDKPINI